MELNVCTVGTVLQVYVSQLTVFDYGEWYRPIDGSSYNEKNGLGY